MRTLYEIIEAAKDGEMPSQEECYWAMLALDSLGTFDRSAIRSIASDLPKPSKFKIELEYKTSFDRIKRALNTDPRKWIGPNYNPSNPEYQKTRQLGKCLVGKKVR
jgi:hypothetical protein